MLYFISIHSEMRWCNIKIKKHILQHSVNNMLKMDHPIIVIIIKLYMFFVVRDMPYSHFLAYSEFLCLSFQGLLLLHWWSFKMVGKHKKYDGYIKCLMWCWLLVGFFSKYLLKIFLKKKRIFYDWMNV